AGISIGQYRTPVPFPIAEPVADIVTQLVVAGEQPHLLIGIAIEVGRFAPAHDPGPSVHDGALESAQLQLEIHVVRHEHLGRVRDGDPFLEGLLELPFTPGHPLGKGGDIEVEDERVIWLDRDQLDVLVADELLEAASTSGEKRRICCRSDTENPSESFIPLSTSD